MLKFRQLLTIVAVLSLTFIWRPIEIRGEDPKPDARTEAAKLRVEAARKAFAEVNGLFETGEVGVDAVATWSLRLLDSHLASASTDEARMTAHKEHLGRVEVVRDRIAKDQESHTRSDRLLAAYYWNEAKYLIAAEGRRLTGVVELKKAATPSEAKVLTNLSRRIFADKQPLFEAGETTGEELLSASRRLLDNEIMTADNDKTRMDVLRDYLARMQARADEIERANPRLCLDVSYLLHLNYCYREAQHFVAAPDVWRPDR